MKVALLRAHQWWSPGSRWDSQGWNPLTTGTLSYTSDGPRGCRLHVWLLVWGPPPQSCYPSCLWHSQVSASLPPLQQHYEKVPALHRYRALLFNAVCQSRSCVITTARVKANQRILCLPCSWKHALPDFPSAHRATPTALNCSRLPAALHSWTAGVF